jgi:hypothetical protein
MPLLRELNGPNGPLVKLQVPSQGSIADSDRRLLPFAASRNCLRDWASSGFGVSDLLLVCTRLHPAIWSIFGICL